jgi:flavodoxin I
MKSVGVFFGSDTGVTEEVTNILIENWDGDIDKHEITNVSGEDFANYDLLFLGISTWYDGDLQSDWEAFFEEFKQIDFTNKTVAIFGLGDQIGYGDYFIDGVGILAEVVENNGGRLVGEWSTEDYDFSESKADKGNGFFYGLAVDHDNQEELTDERIEQWLEQVKEAL